MVAELKVSPSVVEKYVTNIFAKLDLPPTGTVPATIVLRNRSCNRG